MANIPLQSIKFPGLTDTYTVPVVDDTLAVTGAAADAKKTGDEITEVNERLSAIAEPLWEDGMIDIGAVIQYTAGYISNTGSISSAGSSTKEVYSDLIPVDTSHTYTLTLRMAGDPWGGYAYYDSTGTFISRIANSSGFTADGSYYYRTLTVTPPSGTAYIRITGRTYGDYDFAFTDNNSTYTELYERFNQILTEESTDNPLVISDGADGIAVNDCSVAIEPYQDLSNGDPSSTNICHISGWTSVEIVHTGKNLFDSSTLVLRPWNGTGENTARARSTNAIHIPLGSTVTVSVGSDFLATYTYSVQELDTDYPATSFVTDTGWMTSESYTISSTSAPYISVVFRRTDSGRITLSDLMSTSIQVEIGSSATDYEEYNSDSTTYTIDLSTAGTVYGGTLDVTTGVLTVTMAYIASYAGETLPSTWISDRDVYAEGTTPTTGAGVAYTLATTTSYTLTATEIKTLLQNNTLTCNCGDITLSYYADPTARVDQLGDSISTLETGIDELRTLSLTEASGYININGNIQSAGSTTLEVYTNKIPVEYGQTIDISLEYGSYYSMWFAYGTYDSNGAFISRTVLVASVMQTRYSGTVTIPSGVAYISFSYRTYGDYTFTATTNTVLTSKLLAEYVGDKLQMSDYAINENVTAVNHRGYNTEAPENTLPAFKLSKKHGYLWVETDVHFTSDNVGVCIHDSTIDRTSDGSGNVADMTYATLATYDFGSWFSDEYEGTVIPTFEEFIALCKNIGLKPYIELKAGSETQIQSLVSTVKSYGMLDKVTWISFTSTYLEYVTASDDTARVGLLVGTITSNAITTAQSLSTGNNEVFIECDYSTLTDNIVALCIDADLPLEVYTVNSASAVTALDPYVTGVTSDSVISGYELYKANID